MPQIKTKIETEILPIFNGKQTKICLPSGRSVTIRESNGDDDELLSSVVASEDGSNTYNFLAAIIEKDYTTDNRVSPGEIANWPVNDKYGLLFKQRLFVHGDTLAFRATCSEEKCLHEAIYEQDLGYWDGELSLPDYAPKNLSALSKYPNGNKLEIEFVISSGKKLKYSILTGVLEKAALELKDNTRNSPLIIRDLAIENKGIFIPVKHFAGFSAKEMLEIRSHIKKNDKQFDPQVSWRCENPLCKKEYTVGLFSIGAFFYPEEMI